jgi:hypothetical protein
MTCVRDRDVTVDGRDKSPWHAALQSGRRTAQETQASATLLTLSFLEY